MRGNNSDRGQAYTLEGLIGGMVVLMAVLLSLQAVVITPTTGGTIDRTIQAQQQQEVQDSLLVASHADEAENLTLSETIRYWENASDDSAIAFENESDLPQGVYDPEGFENESVLGEVLGERFAEGDGRNYNVELVYQNESERVPADERIHLVYQGQPDTNAFTASTVVTLYEDQHLTGNNETAMTLADVDEKYENGDYEEIPVPNDGDGDVYNVVEVRVVVW
ncbi:DUF7288 family protein [Natrialbaceae archaeon AArc-T1-2]|uniref:DUF7288 family protein n=1 Tax=Natrialbaceae archaeon AArc-T1-2 TaxID=3053904 RepID=UPI00255A9A64|nr:hypothetical protein [Natrialbaceae archaeon AArc-T1-2]WIV67779.1 hypothetical protein QQ977_03340 [Natrialbaceae archaeon AArc-T1-2]